MSAVGSAYDFTNSGEGSYSIEASNLFYYVNPSTGEAATIRADHTDATHSAKLSGELTPASRTTGSVKRATFQSCTSDQQSTITDATVSAQTYAEESQS
jgi:peptidyl-Lys metalloendopeptidase